MDNNELLIRIRYALDIRDIDMVKIFELGGIEVTQEEVRKVLIKSDDGYHDEARSHDDEAEELEENIKCNNKMFESFLNGFIIFKRGKQENKHSESKRKEFTIKSNASVNNVMLKKLKIALCLTSEDILDIFHKAEIDISKGELSAFFRKEGHKHYKDCLDHYARNFLKGLTIKYRS